MRMNSIILLMALIVIPLLYNPPVAGQYNNYSRMTQTIKTLASEYSSICSARSLIKTEGGKDIWLLSVGTGDRDNKPAIAIIGGIEGNHLLGKELALGFASSLLKENQTPEVRDLLNRLTFYIIPDVSPDATEQFFTDLKYERILNSRPVDNDRDFSVNEDPFEDLNRDGYITQVRIKDPSGSYMESPEDRRIMVIADLAEGQTGSWLVISEGIDNDKDGRFNEDGEGGVCFNRNFSFNYEEFGPGAGLHAVSEPESKAVADFLFERFNIYVTFSFGPQDNLGQPMKASDRPAQGRMISSITNSDEAINKHVSDKYHEITGAKGAPSATNSRGNFMEWAYYHYGRYSFSTPGWWFPVEKGKTKEAAFLKFAEKGKMNDVFIPWTAINHPDFPGKPAEVGGIKPFAMINPPADSLPGLISVNYRFIKAIAELHPELEFLDLKTENPGEDVYRLSLKVHNKGIFATCAEVGNQNIWTRIMRISVEPSKGQTILSGQKVQRIMRLEGDQSEEFSWLISGKGNITIKAGAINTGTITATINLK
jgi:hypothetical protein